MKFDLRVLGVLFTLGAACSAADVQSRDVSSATEAETAPAAAPMLDVLLVVDNSVAACQEQNGLAAHIEALVDPITVTLGADVRLAVVTTDGLSEKERGRFHHELPKQFPPNCLERRVVPCLSDGECAKWLTDEVPNPSKWVCEPPSQGATYLTNANGSVNSACRFLCTDQELPASASSQCAAELGVPIASSTYHCVAPGGDLSLRGCLEPPAIQGCPSELPEWADADRATDLGLTVAELSGCMSVVGALQDKNPQLEQGLRTASLALDVHGPNADQAKGFLRAGAYQLIVFLSDEDDCSASEDMPPAYGHDGFLRTEFWGICSLLGDTDGLGPLGEDLATSDLLPAWRRDPSGKGPLVPVHTYVDALRGINADPSRVLVAAIVGGVMRTADGLPAPASDPLAALKCPLTAGQDLEECEAERIEAFYRSKAGSGPLAKGSYICGGPQGLADYGGRYLQLVEAMGANGFAGIVCEDPAPTLAALGAFVVQHLAP